MKHSHIIHHYWTSPCGILDLASIGDELVMCDWVDGCIEQQRSIG